MDPGDTDPRLADLSDEEWQVEEDPPELLAAREKLEQYLATKQGAHLCLSLRCSVTTCIVLTSRVRAVNTARRHSGTGSADALCPCINT